MEATTIVAVRRNGQCAVAGDGQVTFGQNTIMKHNAKKVRRLYGDRVVVGFAGSVADAFTLCERFEAKLEQYSGSLQRAAVELAQEWRSDKILRKLEAMMIAADKEELLVISGSGEVISPDDDVAATGSGIRHSRSQSPEGTPIFRQGDRCQGHHHRGADLRVHQRPHHGGGGVICHRRQADRRRLDNTSSGRTKRKRRWPSRCVMVPPPQARQRCRTNHPRTSSWWAHGRGQDGDRPAHRQAMNAPFVKVEATKLPKWAMWAATWSPWCAIWWKRPSAW